MLACFDDSWRELGQALGDSEQGQGAWSPEVSERIVAYLYHERAGGFLAGTPTNGRHGTLFGFGARSCRKCGSSFDVYVGHPLQGEPPK